MKQSKEYLWYKTIESIEREVNQRKMINKIPKDMTMRKKIRELIDNEYLILDRDNNLIVSGGGRICLFLILSNGIAVEIERLKKNNNFRGYYSLLYFFGKLKHFKLKPEDFDISKVIEEKKQ